MSTSGTDFEAIPPHVTTTEIAQTTEAASTGANATAQMTEVAPENSGVQSTASSPPATTPSFEFTFTPATSVSATPLTFPESVVSQSEFSSPLQTTSPAAVSTTAIPDHLRLRQMEAANRGFSEGLGPRLQLLSPFSSNPFSTGSASARPVFASQGSNAVLASESRGEPAAQRVFQAGIGSQQQNAGQAGEVITPFTLGNRAPRRATSTAGGTRRRLDSMGLKSIVYEPQAGVVATDAKMRAVGRALIEMGIREDQLTEVGVYLARHCADVGASDKSTLLGTFPGSDITLEEVGTRIKQTEGCTLRQYCAYYAKHVWNLMLQTQKPPANWVGKEFKFETRYAAFDFFFGVESSASLEPADGLIRLPTQAERVANNTSKEIQMYRIRSMEGTQAVNFGEVTGGKIGPKPVLSIKK